jgi:transposase-like protein
VAFLQIRCPACQHTDVIKHGITAQGKQRYRCKNASCPSQTFLVEYSHQGRLPEVKQQILEMPLNGRGIRDIARVLHISPTTVIDELKKRAAASIRQSCGHPIQGAKRDPGADPQSGRSRS